MMGIDRIFRDPLKLINQARFVEFHLIGSGLYHTTLLFFLHKLQSC